MGTVQKKIFFTAELSPQSLEQFRCERGVKKNCFLGKGNV
uniref:Uncharacterized protein n=1 Tax=Anguilla anguilla TaxID=7936 RepID=A0A0E9UEA4_ANGAN